MKYANHIKGLRHVTVMFEDHAPITVLNDNKHFPALVAALEQHRYDLVAQLADKASAISSATAGKFTVQNGVIVIDGERLPKVLSDRLLTFIELKLDTSALENFWDNLRHNPSEESKKDLFLFLEKNHIPITGDGCFIGYKKVKNDFTDMHTGKIDQRPGLVVEMDRDKVDPNRHNVCSSGYHVADFSYADKVMGAGKLLKVKVNPADVVSVPVDYQARKMRVCRFQSLEVYDGTAPIPDQLVVQKDDEAEDVTPDFSQEMEAESADVETGSLTESSATATVAKPRERKPKVGKIPFKTLTVIPDKEGRVRIPGVAIRQLGVGVGRMVTATVNDVRSRNIKLARGFKWADDEFHAANDYKTNDDNSIRLSPAFLSEAKIEGCDEYIIRLVGTELEIRGA